MTVIRFEHVSKSYPRYYHLLAGLKTSLLHLPQTVHAFKRERFLALDDVSFELPQSETVGLVGSNGSGKSTTLALIAGVLRAQAGKVEVRGRVAPLLELGAGFHPELTGRENIVLNGILLGLTRAELLAKMDEIIAFSELEAFLDQPLRTYSTGMVARLGFSVVAHLDPEILLIDELLAVGDLHFQLKCRERISEFKRKSVSILLVSHSTEEIRRLCDRVIWLEGGKLVDQGDPDRILKCYEEIMQVFGVSAIAPSSIDLAAPPATFTLTGGGFKDFGFGLPVVNFTRAGGLLAQARTTVLSGSSALTVSFPTRSTTLTPGVPGLSAGPVTVQVFNQTGVGHFSFLGSVYLTVGDSRPAVA